MVQLLIPELGMFASVSAVSEEFRYWKDEHTKLDLLRVDIDHGQQAQQLLIAGAGLQA